MISMDTIEPINETDHDKLFDSRDTIKEAQIDSEIVHAIVTITNAHVIVLASRIDVHDGNMDIQEVTHPYATCHVSYVAAQNTPLQTVNTLHHWNKSRKIN